MMAGGRPHRGAARTVRTAGASLLAALVWACGGGGEPPQESRATIATLGADELQKLVADSRGRVVLVNVWATWCEPCREEFPALLRLRRELLEGDFRLILVSADFASHRGDVEKFLAGQGIDFPTYLKEQGDNEFIEGMSRQWSGALPATWLYRRDGGLAEFWEGSATFETFSGKVRALLDEAARAGGG